VHIPTGDNGEVQLALVSLLLVIVALLVMRAVSRERREYGRFKRLRNTVARRKVYRRWLRESFFMFGGLAAVVLIATSQYVAPVLADTREWTPIARTLAAIDTPLGTGITLAVVALLLAVLILPIFLLRNEKEAIPTVGDIGALLPRNRGELVYGAALGINAGVVEELLFRFALPALLFGILGNGPVAFLLATLLFGMLHLYQGPVGVLTSAILGLVFCAIYVLSGSIVLAVAVHAIFDLRSLLLIPVVVMKVHRLAT
jgi:membrane protease YdiL (CAAX protease family)